MQQGRRGYVQLPDHTGDYCGELLNGMRHGRGVMRFQDGCVYIGDWKNDLREGIGLIVWPGAHAYEGEWKNNVKEGKGVYSWPSGSIYEGEWRDNKRTGHGVFRWNNGDVYTGGWINGDRSGHGVLVWDGGSIYDGEWKNDKRNGRGITRWKDGDVTEGTWVDNEVNGEGSYTSKEFGYTFTGIYRDDYRVHGEIRWLNGDRWVGDCFKDLSCKGEMTLASSGEVITGEWVTYKNLREGKGEMKNSKGEIGEWTDGAFVPLSIDRST